MRRGWEGVGGLSAGVERKLRVAFAWGRYGARIVVVHERARRHVRREMVKPAKCVSMICTLCVWARICVCVGMYMCECLGECTDPIYFGI